MPRPTYTKAADILRRKYAAVFKGEGANRYEVQRSVSSLPATLLECVKGGKYVTVRDEGYEMALDICVRTRRCDIGEEVFAILGKKRRTPRQYEYMITLNAHEGNIARCTDLVAQMKRHKMQPDRRIYSQLLRAIALAPDTAFATPTLKYKNQATKWWHAVEVYKEAVAAGWRSIQLHHSLLFAAQAWSHCSFVLRRMRQHNVTPDVMTYNLLLRIGVRNATDGTALREGQKLLAIMHTKGIRPNVSTYTTLLTACKLADDRVDKATSVLKDMQAQGVEPNRATYAAFAAVAAADWENEEAVRVAEEVLNTAVLKGMHSMELFRAVMGIHANRRDADKAVQLMQLMKVNRCFTTKSILTLFREAEGDGVSRDADHFRTLKNTFLGKK